MRETTAPAPDRRDRAPSDDDADDPIPLMEWIVGAIGLALAVAMIGIILYEGLFVAGRPPDLAVTVERVQPVGAGWLVSFSTRNQGGSTAAQVRVEGRLTRGDAEPEVAEATLDYVPAGSERKGGLFFRSDPTVGRLELHASGYADP